MDPLPVDEHLSEVALAVRSHGIVAIEAPPGTGKTTRIAPSLMSLLSKGQKVFLVQPRRIAAKSVAQRIAWELNQKLGQQIGYSIRFEQRVTDQTQLVVATEGILLRKLQFDPTLQDTAIVVLDEFHERSLDADLLLGMLRRVQSEIREDLRIVIMSATLDRSWFANAIPNAPVIQIDAKSFPVEVQYSPPGFNQDIVAHAAEVAVEVAGRRQGDLLVFLPGAGEIQRCCQMLRSYRSLGGIDIIPLHGSLQIEQQSQAIEVGVGRRIIVATNIAETSLTIPGVQTVIDSGLGRVLRYCPEVGLDRLVLETISNASAVQRAGRAGRVAPGLCIRLWSDVADRARAPFLEPEIRRVDLCNARLQLHAWGEGDRSDFPWIEAPRSDAWASAGRLLEQLGSVRNGAITKLGEQMSLIPLHPRLARLCIESMKYNCLNDAALLAAMLSERDPFDRRGSGKGPGPGTGVPTRNITAWQSDCVERLEWFRKSESDRPTPFGWLNQSASHSIRKTAQQIVSVCEGMLGDSDHQKGGIPNQKSSQDKLSWDIGLQKALMVGFPDRLAKRRAPGKPQGLMVGGKGVVLSPESGLRDPELFLCVDVQGGGNEAVVRQASAVEMDWLRGDGLTTKDEMFFHPSQKQVVGRRRTYWQDLCLSETPVAIEDELACAECLYQAVKANWDLVYPKDDPSIIQWIERVGCLSQWVPELDMPPIDTPRLQQVAEELCRGKRSLAEVRQGPWLDWLGNLLTAEQSKSLQVETPERIEVPSGSWLKIQYAKGKPPVLAVKIQEVFSWKQTPRIARGRVPLLLHLLAPSGRAQQITDDLASFWASGYAEVKKELKRRYPKHSWPDDPWTATPTRK